MAYGIDTIYEKETGNKITFAPSKDPEGGGVKSIAVWDGNQIKNVSLDDLRMALGVTSCWKNWGAHLGVFESVGWRRIAEGADSCTISIKRLYNVDYSESHKVELINKHYISVFKSIYDIANDDAFFITKIRQVLISRTTFIDIFYGATNSNGVCVTIDDARSSTGTIYKILDTPQIVPETTDGETVLATMDFGANTWMGQPL